MKLTAFFVIIAGALIFHLSCSKTGGIPPPPPPDPCSIANLNLSGAVMNPSVSGASDGSITLSASGGSNFTFSMNGGAFQSSPMFKYLPAGNYTVMARSAEGCSASISFVLTNPTISCSSINIVVTATTTSNVPCEANSASLGVIASGGTAPYSFSIDGGAFQWTNSFSNLASGGHIVTAKDANGCTGTTSVTVGNQPAGPLFQQAKAVILYYCSYCHSSTNASGGIHYSVDCNIVANKARIMARAIDGNPSPMPQSGLMPPAQRQKIMDWLNAGGRFSD
jgi:hypothetical protein